MIDATIGFSIRHRAAVIGLWLAVAALGAWAAWQTPVDAIPDLSEDQILVFADWKGHAPREIEDQVTYPLALGLRGLHGVRVVRSSSEVGFALVSVILSDGAQVADGRQRIAERLERVRDQLPAGASVRLGPDAAATGQIYWYTVEGGGLDLGRLRALQEWYVGPQLGSVPGVAEVSSVGGFPTEYEVAVDPRRLPAVGLTLGDVLQAVERANATSGGHVIQQGNAEVVVRGVGWLGASPVAGDDRFDPARVVRDLENVSLPAPEGPIRLGEVARVALAPGSRRGVLEKDGNEVVGGVILMASGENPLEVTRRIKTKVRELGRGLPPGVKIVPFYDRTPLIEGAVATVSGAVVEAMITASLCVLVVLLHVRTSFIIAISLPLAALSSFLIMALLRRLGIVEIQANAMSMAGIAISVGVLVDSSVVMAENVMHRLRARFGDEPVRGDVRAVVLPACRAVGRPIVFSVVIMLLSFLPVFALGGIEGKMFRPLAYTKSFALLAVAVLAITLVPALCSIFIRGRLRSERDNPLVRAVIDVYRSVLAYLLDRPAALAWLVGATFLLGLAPLGSRPLFLGTLFLALAATTILARGRRAALAAPASLVLLALVADGLITPLDREFVTPLDEGMVMDMPITVPRTSVTQAADDLKARDMVLCRFPEVDMVVGKAGRAESATDPAPIDMIETMVSFRPHPFWPRRKLRAEDARRQALAVLDALAARKAIRPPDRKERRALAERAAEAALTRFDVVIREYAHQRNMELVRASGGRSPGSVHPSDPEEARLLPLWYEHVRRLNGDLVDRAARVFTRLVAEELLDRTTVIDDSIASHLAERKRIRAEGIAALAEASARRPSGRLSLGGGHHHAPSGPALFVPAHPTLDTVEQELSQQFAGRLLLWTVGRDELAGFGGELDRAVSMPGWTNVWTMPIQNRVDMLATGVNTTVGIRVLGRSLDEVVRASEAIAEAVRKVRGAADVVADPVRGKSYLEIRFDRTRAARLGVSVGEANETIEAALAGRVVTTTVEGRERHPVVVRYDRADRQDVDAVRRLLVPSHRRDASRPGLAWPRQAALSDVAEVQLVEGPATIKAENGLLRNYVRLNVRQRDSQEFVADARRQVERNVKLPAGVFVEWTGQFEHEARSRRTLLLVVPLVIASIFLVLYWTYRDLADAALMMLAVPGAVAGGLFFQWCLGFKLSVTVWVGYIACFGMATSTGIIMLVYLREAVEQAGGLERMDLAALRQAVMDGAVHRLRPKLLTEGTVVIGLAPMLWASGVASEIIRPMAAPVMGGVLVADEMIDLLLPVLFYWVRRQRWARLNEPPRPAELPAQDVEPVGATGRTNAGSP